MNPAKRQINFPYFIVDIIAEQNKLAFNYIYMKIIATLFLFLVSTLSVSNRNDLYCFLVVGDLLVTLKFPRTAINYPSVFKNTNLSHFFLTKMYKLNRFTVKVLAIHSNNISRNI